MIEKKIIIFIVENSKYKNYLLVPLEKALYNKKIKIKSLYMDSLIEIKNMDKSQVTKKIRDLVRQLLIKDNFISASDIGKIVYVVDIDECFYKNTEQNLNKQNFLKVLFNIEFIPLGKKNSKDVTEFEVVFMSRNLTNIIHEDENSYSNDEIEEKLKAFSNRCFESFEEYIKLFGDNNVRYWNSYKESYNGILTTTTKSSNMNCLLEELGLK